MGHVFARLSGFGVTLTPVWPYAFTYVDGSVLIATEPFDSTSTVRVAVKNGRAVIPEHPNIFMLGEGPEERTWRIETSACSIPWPTNFTLESAPEGDPTPFYLLDGKGAAIFLQGPLRRDGVPPLRELVAPGQRVLRSVEEKDFSLVEVAYEHEEQTWHQCHLLVPHGQERLVVITAQSPEPAARLTREAAEFAARNLRRDVSLSRP
ncbi:hypothetical protein GCM10027589_10540 [Actinocorallia lasiicapitis]